MSRDFAASEVLAIDHSIRIDQLRKAQRHLGSRRALHSKLHPAAHVLAHIEHIDAWLGV